MREQIRAANRVAAIPTEQSRPISSRTESLSALAQSMGDPFSSHGGSVARTASSADGRCHPVACRASVWSSWSFNDIKSSSLRLPVDSKKRSMVTWTTAFGEAVIASSLVNLPAHLPFGPADVRIGVLVEPPVLLQRLPRNPSTSPSFHKSLMKDKRRPKVRTRTFARSTTPRSTSH